MSDDNRPTFWSEWCAPRRIDAIWYVLPLLVVLAGFGLLPLRSWDYWWHITIGRLIDYWSAIPSANHFLYTVKPDEPSLIQPWVGELSLYGLHSMGRVHLTLLVRNIFVAIGVVMLTRSAARRAGSAKMGGAAVLAALPFLFTWVEARPHLFAWPLFLGLLLTGYRVRRRRWSTWAVVAFPIAAALWANIHGSFPLAAVLAAIFLASAVSDRWLRPEAFSKRHVASWSVGLLGAGAAPLLTPHGPEVYAYVWSMATHEVVQTSVTEWLPTWFGNPPVVGPLFYLTVLGGAALLWRNRESTDVADAMLFAVFALLAGLQARAQLWWAFVWPLTVAPALGALSFGSADQTPPLWLQRVHALVIIVAFAFGAAVQPYWQWRINWTAESDSFQVRSTQPLKGVVPRETPFDAVQILDRQVIPPRIFHDEKYAGFLAFHLTGPKPRQILFVDHRIELPPPRIWEMYANTSRMQNVWRGVFHQYDVQAAVLDTDDQAALVEQLDDSELWWQVRNQDGWAFFLHDASAEGDN